VDFASFSLFCFLVFVLLSVDTLHRFNFFLHLLSNRLDVLLEVVSDILALLNFTFHDLLMLGRKLLVLISVLRRDNMVPRLDVLSSRMAVQIFVGLVLVKLGLLLICGRGLVYLSKEENDLSLEEIVQRLRFLFNCG
jgi:hypothetical protein